MTNTKPTWEEEFNYFYAQLTCYKCETTALVGETFQDLKAFIKKVHDEAYERGKKDGKSEVEDDIRYNYDIKELV